MTGRTVFAYHFQTVILVFIVPFFQYFVEA